MLVAAFAKEFWDYQEHAEWSWGDILADIGGIGFALLLLLGWR